MRKFLSYFLPAICMTLLFSGSANAVFDVSAIVDSFKSDGQAALTAIGLGLLVLGGLAIVIKWSKAAIFG